MVEIARQLDTFPDNNNRGIFTDNNSVESEQTTNTNSALSNNSNIVPFVSRTSNVQKNYSRAKATGTAARTAGAAVIGASVVAQGTGKAVGGVGKGVTRAGVALSSTGIGAIVGVPLTAVGALTTGAGKGLEVGGKSVRQTVKKVRKTSTGIGRVNKIFGIDSNNKAVVGRVGYNPILQRRRDRLIQLNTEVGVDKAKVKSRARVLLAVGWIVSFPIAVFNGLFIFLFTAWTEVQAGGAGAVWNILRSSVETALTRSPGAAAETAAMVGFYFNSETLIAFMVACWAIGFTLAAAFLFVALKTLSGVGAETKNSSIKEGLVLVAFVAAFMPMANIWPWTNTLIKHISKHPE